MMPVAASLTAEPLDAVRPAPTRLLGLAPITDVGLAAVLSESVLP